MRWCAPWLAGAAGSEFSQFGEDGLIGAVFERIGETNRWCFEVGAGDGEQFSNVRRLIDLGWRALLIEKEDAAFEKLVKLRSDRVQCLHALLPNEGLDAALSGAGAPEEPDLGVVDVDGQDWWFWHHLNLHRPRIVLIEFAEGPAAFKPEESGPGQAGYDAIMKLGEYKGYVAVAATRVNLLFVESGCL